MLKWKSMMSRPLKVQVWLVSILVDSTVTVNAGDGWGQKTLSY